MLQLILNSHSTQISYTSLFQRAMSISQRRTTLTLMTKIRGMASPGRIARFLAVMDLLIFFRLLTVAQIIVFLVKCIVRASQHLTITSLELTTLAFIFAMMLASWFWRRKPQDINKPIALKCKASIAEILTNVRLLARMLT